MGRGRHAKPSRFRPFRSILTMAVLLAVALAVVVLATPLPPGPGRLSTKFYDQNGQFIASLSTAGGIYVPLQEISPYVPQAFIAVEDRHFYYHPGVDPMALIRALLRNIRAGRVVEGGSTITQQLAKNLYLTQQRTLTRKLKELILTFKLEATHSKNEILEMYINYIYYGEGAVGIEEAARTYFGKSAKDLTLAEAALLAGLPRGPNIYSPYVDLKRARERRAEVLAAMQRAGQITKKQAGQATEQPIRLVNRNKTQTKAPYFIQYVTDEMERRYKISTNMALSEGYTVYTTLDLKTQQAAEEAFLAGMPPGVPDENGVLQPQGALVAIDPQTGFIRAMIGGRSFAQSSYNRAAYALRQPGSAFKPFVYTTALANGYLPTSQFVCEPVSIRLATGERYTPIDYNNRYHYAPLTLRRAIAVSDNVVSVRLNVALTPQKSIPTARACGIDQPIDPTPAMVLGTMSLSPLKLTAAYAPFANGGKRVEPQAILRIIDRNGRVLADNKPRLAPAIDPRVAYIMTDMLKSVLQPGGTGAALGPLISRPAAGKTGTTENSRDVWFVGYTPDLVTAVWIGNDNGTSLRDTAGPNPTGGGLAGPIWAQMMAGSLTGVPARDFTRPPGVVEVLIDGDHPEYLAADYTPNPMREVYLAGTEPKEVSPYGRPAPEEPLIPPDWWNFFFGNQPPQPSPPPAPEVPAPSPPPPPATPPVLKPEQTSPPVEQPAPPSPPPPVEQPIPPPVEPPPTIAPPELPAPPPEPPLPPPAPAPSSPPPATLPTPTTFDGPET